jgi:hypothetical protein
LPLFPPLHPRPLRRTLPSSSVLLPGSHDRGYRRSPLPSLLPLPPTPHWPREGHPEPAIDARRAHHTSIHPHPPPHTTPPSPYLPWPLSNPRVSSREVFPPGGQPECTTT